MLSPRVDQRGSHFTRFTYGNGRKVVLNPMSRTPPVSCEAKASGSACMPTVHKRNQESIYPPLSPPINCVGVLEKVQLSIHYTKEVGLRQDNEII